MMTKHSRADEPEMCNRNVMVLGLEMDPDTLEYTAIHIARFSYSPVYCRDDENFLIPRSLERRGLVTGLTQNAVLKIDRTDFVPLTQEHFYGDVYDVQRIGKVSPELFSDIRNSMKAGHERAEHSRSRFPGRNTSHWYLPAMHLAGSNIPSPHHEHEFTALCDIDLARIQVDWVTRKDPGKLDAEYVTTCMANVDRAQQALARQINWEARHKPRPHVHPLRHKEPFPTAAGKSLPETLIEEETVISPQESFLMLLPRATPSGLQSLKAIADRFNKASAELPFIKIELPQHMWQGRYLMVKVPDLHDENDDREAFRPCAVWKAYADRDTGALAGLELHPVTRGSLNSFRYRFQVYPLPTQSKRPGHLIADCLVRVPLTERYFHEKSSQFFFELPPDKLEKFRDRRAHAMASGDPVHVYGLQEIPENWVEVELDPTPSFQQFLKWSESGKIRFDGTVTDKARARQRERKFSHAYID